ncbi:MAG: hypothetical protein CR967_03540 [Proteobacteria bacterium]|nr:MAG: hypothetical protein CR967_03540 [Pseudomonadota bacterium]
MNARLTLYSERSLIDEIKKIAKENNTSVSRMVNEFFKKTLKDKRKEKKDGRTLMDLAGCLKDANIPEDMSYKDIMHQHWEEKYL